MSAIIVDGKAIADTLLENLKIQLDALGEPLHMAAICGGEDEGVRGFVRVKQKAAQSVGILFSTYMFEGTDEQEIIDTLRYLATDDSVHGIFVELPLPSDWDRDRILALIPPEKDVDALTGRGSVPAPAVRALQYVFDEHPMNLRGVRAAVVGQGFLVGAPVAQWLDAQGAQVDRINIDTPDPERRTRQADLVITGVGTPGLITGDWIREGAAVIDYGYAKKGKDFVGDVDHDSVIKKAGLITPVPGGMGPLVVAAVLENLLLLALNKK
jgi:methylenetetrahydrofolate dehydrogenase (NADP+) / methenyltetrahydrofolate cyclohydrolase